jgi:hypothetical protein
MNNKFNIAALVDDLEPVTALTPRRPLMIAAAILVAMIAVIVGVQGMRADVMAGQPDEMFLIRAGILLLLGDGARSNLDGQPFGRQKQQWLANRAGCSGGVSVVRADCRVNRRHRTGDVRHAIGNAVHDV